MKFNFSDLETNGFVILNNVVSMEEIDILIQNHKTASSSIQFTFSDKINSDTGLPVSTLKSTIESILKDINRETTIKTDRVSSSGVYFNNNYIKLDWHQDHEVFYKTQDTFNNLNFWIPIIKPNADQNGIRIIPFKTLNEKIPEITEKYIIHKGAQKFKFKDNKTTIFNDDAGTHVTLDEDILSLSEEINISPGDILIFRGDVIHRTSADTTTNRVAIAIRSMYSEGIFSKSKFFNDCAFKKNQIQNNPRNYHHIINKLEEEPDREFFKINEFTWSTSFRGTSNHYGLRGVDDKNLL